MIKAIFMSISVCVLVGCRSSRSVEAAGELINAGATVFPDGCTVTPPDGKAVWKYTGRTYVLPEQAYNALLLTP